MNQFFTTNRLKWLTVYLLLTLAILLFCLNLLSVNAAPSTGIPATPSPTHVIHQNTPNVEPTTPSIVSTPIDTVTPTTIPIPTAIPTIPLPTPTKPGKG